MVKFINFTNLLILFICGIFSVINSDLFALTALLILSIIYKFNKCVSQAYLMIVFNLNFTIRYVEIGFFKNRHLFEDDYFINLNGAGKYLLIASIFYLFIFFSINLATIIFQNKNSSKLQIQGRIFAAGGAASIILFAAASLSGAYRIGIDVGDSFNRLLMRISNYLNFFNPAIFFYKYWIVFIALFSISSLFFGSKAFIYNVGIYIVQYGLILNIKIKKKYFLTFFLMLIISFLLFNVVTSYRLSGIYEFGSILPSLSGVDNFLEFYSFARTRWGGLDTLIIYGDSEYAFSGQQIINEIRIAINNLMPPFLKFPFPEYYTSSELMTGSLFRGYDFFAVPDGQPRTTDSMFGISRFIVAGYWGYLLFFCFMVFSLFLITDNIFLTILFRMAFFNTILIGGTYFESIKIALELFLFIGLYKLGLIYKLSNIANNLLSHLNLSKFR